MPIGQLFYNIEQPDENGEYLIKISSPEITESGLQIFGQDNNIVYQYINIKIGSSISQYARFTRLGVQATPGTKIVLNQTKNIIIGRTGFYEIEADIKHMYIILQHKYIEDTEKMIQARKSGAKSMIIAENWRKQQLNLLESKIMPDGSDNKMEYYDPDVGKYTNKYNEIKKDYSDFWEQYIKIQDQFYNLGFLDENNNKQKSYTEAKSEYTTGINGIYKRVDSSDEESKKEVKNLIIDFEWTNNE